MLSLRDIYIRKFFFIFFIVFIVIVSWLVFRFSDSYLIAFFVGLFVVDALMTIKFNKKILNDVDVVKKSLKSVVNKEYNIAYFTTTCCKEFEDISESIRYLSKKLQKREKQKQNYTKKLKAITKKQNDVISAISHEFKNPVAAIIGYAQTVKEDDAISRDMRVKFLEKVLNNANKISNMIDRLSLAIKLENENIKITFDKTMFENLLINLVENALKYSEDEITIKIKDNKLEVIDRGIGIEQEDLKRLTEKFFRVDTLSWDNSIGVGLYIVKYILKLHGLELFIESKKGVGSKFWFELKR